MGMLIILTNSITIKEIMMMMMMIIDPRPNDTRPVIGSVSHRPSLLTSKLSGMHLDWLDQVSR